MKKSKEQRKKNIRPDGDYEKNRKKEDLPARFEAFPILAFGLGYSFRDGS